MWYAKMLLTSSVLIVFMQNQKKKKKKLPFHQKQVQVDLEVWG